MSASAFNKVPSIIAVGDLHGNFSGFKKILRSCGILGEDDHWKATSTHLVQMGDIVGRGGEPGKIFGFLKKLEEEALQFDSRVHILLGNHEAMTLFGLYSYNTAEEFRDFADESMMHSFPVEKGKGKLRAKTAATVRAPAKNEDGFPVGPPGWSEFRFSMGPLGMVGKWLSTHNTAVKINDSLFVHAGLTRDYGFLPLEILNRSIRRELKKRRTSVAEDRSSVALHKNGPQWTRDYTLKRNEEMGDQLDDVLRFHRCKRMVVGHTPTFFIDRSKTGRILPLYDGKMMCIDTGIGKAYGEHLSALRIEGDTLSSIYP